MLINKTAEHFRIKLIISQNRHHAAYNQETVWYSWRR